MSFLEFENIHAGYGKKEVLHGLSFAVDPGEVVALLGGNGAGKSTALKVAAGVLCPQSGCVRLRGEGITGMEPHEIRGRGLSYLPQGGRVFGSLTVADNLALAGSRHSTRNPQEPIFEELAGLRMRRAGLLSGGERQMLAMEMALTSGTDILLLDEPTAALSESTAVWLLARLAEIVREGEHVGILLVEQNVEIACHIADRTLRLAGGLVESQEQSRTHTEGTGK
jgi:ABC-type branched-subunit amino acid transport system ATPase component